MGVKTTVEVGQSLQPLTPNRWKSQRYPYLAKQRTRESFRLFLRNSNYLRMRKSTGPVQSPESRFYSNPMLTDSRSQHSRTRRRDSKAMPDTVRGCQEDMRSEGIFICKVLTERL